MSPCVTPSASRNSTTPAPSLNRLSPTIVRAQARRQAGAAQQAFDDDRVGRGEDGAEHETPDQRHGGAEAQQRPHAVAENDRGQDHADGGEQQDDPAPPVQFADVDVEAAGEQQAAPARRRERDAADRRRRACRETTASRADARHDRWRRSAARPTSEPSSMPIAGGSLVQMWLTQPISTASASTMAKRSTGPIARASRVTWTSYWQFFTRGERRSRRPALAI